MSTQQYVNDGTIASTGASGRRGIDPQRRRFALNPNIYMAMMDARESGRQEMLLPVGLVTFRTVPMVDDDFDNVERNGKNPSARHQSTIRDFPAMYFLSNAVTRYGELGMRELSCLTLMDDPEKNQHGNVTKEAFSKSAQGYFAALWPSFADIGHQCPSELQECVTCRLWLIGDPASAESMHEGLEERAAKLADQSKVAELRQQIFESLATYQAWLTNKWAALLGERDDRKHGGPGLAKLGPGEHHVRRNLHEIEPSEAATAAGFGAEVAAGQAEGFKELAAAMREGKGGDNSDLMRMIIERQNKTDETLGLLAQSLKALVDKQSEK
jgi:hypothetical protein